MLRLNSYEMDEKFVWNIRTNTSSCGVQQCGIRKFRFSRVDRRPRLLFETPNPADTRRLSTSAEMVDTSRVNHSTAAQSTAAHCSVITHKNSSLEKQSNQPRVRSSCSQKAWLTIMQPHVEERKRLRELRNKLFGSASSSASASATHVNPNLSWNKTRFVWDSRACS